MIVRSASFFIVNDFAIRHFSTHGTHTADDTSPRRPYSGTSGTRPYRFVSTKSNLPRGLYISSHRGTTLMSQISWYIHERGRAPVTRAARVSGRCVRRASVASVLCARNNRCIIRFQSGLGVICIDLLSSHCLFGDCGHVCALPPSAIREPLVYLVLPILRAHVSKPGTYASRRRKCQTFAFAFVAVVAILFI